MLRTLGQLSLDGASPQRVKPLLLLAYLAVEGNQDRTSLADVFWPESESPLNSLSVTLNRLKQPQYDPVKSNRYTVELSLETDVQAFLRSAERGNHKAALEFYGGPFLHGVVPPGIGAVFENWLYDTRESLAAKACDCLLAVAEQQAQAGQHDLAAHYAETAYTLPAAPPAEPETLQLMHRLLRNGNSAVADAVAVEAQEVGISLGSATQPIPPKQPDESTPNNLTKAPLSFVGRETELESLTAQLRDPQCRLLSLIGPGGIGKSRLAHQLANSELETRAWEGVYLIPLASLKDSSLIPVRIAEALSLSFKGKESPLDLVARFVGDKHLLLILDNVEHLLEHIEVLQTLLASCPNLSLLATSRARLNLQEEWGTALGGLSYPAQADVSSSDLLTYSAPELFYRRAKQLQVDFTFNAADAEQVAKLCGLVEGSPLALELAAPWLRAMPLTDIVQELENSFDLLVDTHKNRDGRHKSMSVVLEHSWGLLAPEEQSALAKLSIFEGGSTREAAAAVADVSLLKLTEFIDKSLLRQEGKRRYGFHPLTKQYLRQQLHKNSETNQEVKNRHAKYFFSLAEEAKSKLEGEEQKVWLEQLDIELDNIRTVLRWTMDQMEPDKAFKLMISLEIFWRTHGSVEGLSWLSQALDLPGGKDEALKVKALMVASGLAELQGELETAHCYLNECISPTERLGDQALISKLFEGLCAVLARLGNHATAQVYAEKSLAIERSLNNQSGVAGLLNKLGAIENFRGNYLVARKYFKESLEIKRALENQLQIAILLGNLGANELNIGDYLAARHYLEESLAISRSLRYPFGIASSFANLGIIEKTLGNYEAAELHYKESLSIGEDIGNQHLVASLLGDLCGLAVVERNLAVAQEYLAKSSLMSLKIDSKSLIITSLENAARISCLSNQFTSAVRIWGSADKLRREIGEPLEASKRQVHKSELSIARENLDIKTFKAAWEAGQKMTFEEAVEYALQDSER